MKRLILALLPLILAVLLNPILILYVYEKINVERPDALILVNGLRSELKANSGDKISVDVSHTVTETTTLRVEKLPDSVLEIDHSIVNGSEVTLGPGKHSIRYVATIPEVSFPQKREILLLQPMTNSEKGLALIPFILPRNWDLTLIMLIPTGAIMSFVGTIGTILSLLNIRELAKFKVREEEKERIERELKQLQMSMNALRGKVVSLVGLLSGITEKYGIPEDELLEGIKNYSFVEKEPREIASKGVEGDKESLPETEESSVRLVLPLRKLVNRIRRT